MFYCPPVILWGISNNFIFFLLKEFGEIPLSQNSRNLLTRYFRKNQSSSSSSFFIIKRCCREISGASLFICEWIQQPCDRQEAKRWDRLTQIYWMPAAASRRIVEISRKASQFISYFAGSCNAQWHVFTKESGISHENSNNDNKSLC